MAEKVLVQARDPSTSSVSVEGVEYAVEQGVIEMIKSHAEKLVKDAAHNFRLLGPVENFIERKVDNFLGRKVDPDLEAIQNQHKFDAAVAEQTGGQPGGADGPGAGDQGQGGQQGGGDPSQQQTTQQGGVTGDAGGQTGAGQGDQSKQGE